jgi:hypothetical protein
MATDMTIALQSSGETEWGPRYISKLSTEFTLDPAFPVTGSPCITGRTFGMVGLLNRATFAQQVAPEKANTVSKTPTLRNLSDIFAVM